MALIVNVQPFNSIGSKLNKGTKHSSQILDEQLNYIAFKYVVATGNVNQHYHWTDEENEFRKNNMEEITKRFMYMKDCIKK